MIDISTTQTTIEALKSIYSMNQYMLQHEAAMKEHAMKMEGYRLHLQQLYKEVSDIHKAIQKHLLAEKATKTNSETMIND